MMFQPKSEDEGSFVPKSEDEGSFVPPSHTSKLMLCMLFGVILGASIAACFLKNEKEQTALLSLGETMEADRDSVDAFCLDQCEKDNNGGSCASYSRGNRCETLCVPSGGKCAPGTGAKELGLTPVEADCEGCFIQHADKRCTGKAAASAMVKSMCDRWCKPQQDVLWACTAEPGGRYTSKDCSTFNKYNCKGKCKLTEKKSSTQCRVK